MMFLPKEKNVDITDFYFPLHDVYDKQQTGNSRQLRVTKGWKFTFFNLSHSFEKLLDVSR